MGLCTRGGEERDGWQASAQLLLLLLLLLLLMPRSWFFSCLRAHLSACVRRRRRRRGLLPAPLLVFFPEAAAVELDKVGEQSRSFEVVRVPVYVCLSVCLGIEHLNPRAAFNAMRRPLCSFSAPIANSALLPAFRSAFAAAAAAKVFSRSFCGSRFCCWRCQCCCCCCCCCVSALHWTLRRSCWL